MGTSAGPQPEKVRFDLSWAAFSVWTRHLVWSCMCASFLAVNVWAVCVRCTRRLTMWIQLCACWHTKGVWSKWLWIAPRCPFWSDERTFNVTRNEIALALCCSACTGVCPCWAEEIWIAIYSCSMFASFPCGTTYVWMDVYIHMCNIPIQIQRQTPRTRGWQRLRPAPPSKRQLSMSQSQKLWTANCERLPTKCTKLHGWTVRSCPFSRIYIFFETLVCMQSQNTRTHTYSQAHAQTQTCTRTQTHIHTHTHTHTYTQTCAYTPTHTLSLSHTHTNTHTYTYTQTHTHSCTHALTLIHLQTQPATQIQTDTPLPCVAT